MRSPFESDGLVAVERLERRRDVDLDAAARRARAPRTRPAVGGISGRIFGAASTSTQRWRAVAEARVVAQRVLHEIGELRERLDARVAGADEDEGQVRRSRGAGSSSRVGGLELAQHVVAQVDRVREVLEPEPRARRGPGPGSVRATAPSASTRCS